VSQLAVVVVLEKRVSLLSVFIGVCVGCTSDSGRCGRPVRWRWTVIMFYPIEDKGGPTTGYPALTDCVSCWVMGALRTCLACFSLSCFCVYLVMTKFFLHRPPWLGPFGCGMVYWYVTIGWKFERSHNLLYAETATAGRSIPNALHAVNRSPSTIRTLRNLSRRSNYVRGLVPSIWTGNHFCG
jgi:hypothetical protein